MNKKRKSSKQCIRCQWFDGCQTIDLKKKDLSKKKFKIFITENYDNCPDFKRKKLPEIEKPIVTSNRVIVEKKNKKKEEVVKIKRRKTKRIF